MRYVVDPSGGGTHTILQAAIDDAARGDVVLCVPGVYAETVPVPARVTLVCASFRPNEYRRLRDAKRNARRRMARYIAKGGVRR